ncbi:MAG: trehalose-6-phosphate synthase [Planctomycetes bacterium]|nr:trehalose-6-phosphate synthase [Planctomycetota bacterium]
MYRSYSVILILILGLGLLTWAASMVVNQTIRGWFERDMALRAQLAVSGARMALIFCWRQGNQEEIRKLLTAITHDDRIMAAAACDANLSVVSKTADFPDQISLVEIGHRVRPMANSPPEEWKEWQSIADLSGGKVHVSAIPLFDDRTPLGFVALIHDMSYIDRREARTQQFLLIAFAVLAVAASVVTLIVAKLSWKGWTREIRRLLRGGVPIFQAGSKRAEFHPLLRDVRDLVEQISADKEMDGHGGAWTPQRLKQTLSHNLEGERIIIVANREPYIHQRDSDGRVTILNPASGLVTALEPVMRACSGVWIAHGSGSADRENSDSCGRLRVPPGEESYLLRRIWLSPEEEKGYYYGFANEGLWPLCHIAHNRPVFRSEDWKHYLAVNQKFADAVCEEASGEDPIILMQDYHFALAPYILRERLPHATIITFWHIPWPNSESFGICPWRQELLQGLLGSSIMGFHTRFHCNNFIEAVDRFLESRIDREEIAVIHKKRKTLVRPYPISVEWPNRLISGLPSQVECRAAVLKELNLNPDALIGVGVDRLDYTKGIEERFLAIERLLERFPDFRERFTFIQLAAPSRSAIERYRQLDESVQRLADRINSRFAGNNYRPIVLLRAHHGHPIIFRYYRAANLCYVSSLHDGMNLVAKEFVSARDDEKGVLVLSQFTGASRELTEALIVNPYDLEQASEALANALSMPPLEQQDRMRAMRSLLSHFNVYRWAGRMLIDAAQLRKQERLSGRLVHRFEGTELVT